MQAAFCVCFRLEIGIVRNRLLILWTGGLTLYHVVLLVQTIQRPAPCRCRAQHPGSGANRDFIGLDVAVCLVDVDGLAETS